MPVLTAALRVIKYFEGAGFVRQRELDMSHKKAALMRVTREAWEAPCL